MDYRVLAYYCYREIESPEKEVKRHHLFLEDLDVRARVYIAKNGMNAQMSFAKKDLETYLEWMREDPRFADILFKIDPYHEHIYPRVTIKKRDQLVALDQNPDLKKSGSHLEPEAWKRMLEKRSDDTLLIDVRNDYESRIGHFDGALCPDLKTFRQFPEYAEKLAQERDPQKTKIMMYCTGGIRCETYSALLKEKGFEQVYQLEGGVIHYGHEMGNQHWKGKLFVFDDRLSVPISDDEHELISSCNFCAAKTDSYYNCANMDCNALFLACSDCAKKQQGCCSKGCEQEPRRRPFIEQDRPKPFRKWYHYAKNKEMSEDDEPCSCFS